MRLALATPAARRRGCQPPPTGPGSPKTSHPTKESPGSGLILSLLLRSQSTRSATSISSLPSLPKTSSASPPGRSELRSPLRPPCISSTRLRRWLRSHHTGLRRRRDQRLPDRRPRGRGCGSKALCRRPVIFGMLRHSSPSPRTRPPPPAPPRCSTQGAHRPKLRLGRGHDVSPRSRQNTGFYGEATFDVALLEKFEQQGEQPLSEHNTLAACGQWLSRLLLIVHFM
jgi:hypothetical protein